MTNSNRKGKRIERLLASKFRNHGWDARRGQQYKGTPDSPDVIIDLPLTVESKGCEVWRIDKWMSKLLGERKSGTLPLLCCKKNHAEFLTIIPLNFFLELTQHIDWESYQQYRNGQDELDKCRGAGL